MKTTACPACLHVIKLTFHQRESLKRGNQPRCPVCNPRAPECAVCKEPHRTREHVFEGAPLCSLCAGLPHRVVGPRCRSCKLRYEDEPPVELEDVMHSHMGRVADIGGAE